ncbi:sigma-70 family RNA polymerase sigma factor [Candidatus Gracilibacteria bacterium]|nr:sigma-70 family RNA polymerase sigma factor [Candidatus Gracilibacteria bacterium]MCF7819707.1 sigma-70 family RNA polymerase sigma factor [Candidatus Gracilibacteria bacterium]
MHNESSLILDCQHGNRESFAPLYDMYAQKIYGFLFHKTLHRETAEDLTSETFLKALEKIETYNAQKASFSTWLFQIARNTVIDYFRTSRHTDDIDDIWDIDSGEDVLEKVDAKIAYKKIQHHLSVLSADQREILTMRFWQDMSYAEIAQALGKTESSVKMAACRGVKKLKKELFLFLFFPFLF